MLLCPHRLISDLMISPWKHGTQNGTISPTEVKKTLMAVGVKYSVLCSTPSLQEGSFPLVSFHLSLGSCWSGRILPSTIALIEVLHATLSVSATLAMCMHPTGLTISQLSVYRVNSGGTLSEQHWDSLEYIKQVALGEESSGLGAKHLLLTFIRFPISFYVTTMYIGNRGQFAVLSSTNRLFYGTISIGRGIEVGNHQIR